MLSSTHSNAFSRGGMYGASDPQISLRSPTCSWILDTRNSPRVRAASAAADLYAWRAGSDTRASLVSATPRAPSLAGANVFTSDREDSASRVIRYKAQTTAACAGEADGLRVRRYADLPSDDPPEKHIIDAPLPEHRIRGKLVDRLRRLGADQACQQRWISAALADPVQARYFDQFFGQLESDLGRSLKHDPALRVALAELLDRIATTPERFASYGKLAHEALGYCGNRVVLGLNGMLVTGLEEAISCGAYDGDLRALDKVMRSLYGFEALRVATEERILQDIRKAPVASDAERQCEATAGELHSGLPDAPRHGSGDSSEYKDPPVEVHLAVQAKLCRRLALPPILPRLNYANPSGFEPADYRAIEREVRESERYGYGIYLAHESTHWLAVMERVDPEGVESARTTQQQLYHDWFDTDVQAYCDAHPAQTRDEAAVVVNKRLTFEAYAPLMRKHLDALGLWPVDATVLPQRCSDVQVSTASEHAAAKGERLG